MFNRKTWAYDIIMLALIITSIVFYDIKPVFLSSQFVAVLFAFLSLSKIKTSKKSILPKFVIWAMLFVMYSALSILWASEDNNTVISTVLATLQAILISITIIVYCGSESGSSNKIIQYMTYASIVLVTRFILTIPISDWGNGERFSKETIFGSNAPAIALAYTSVILLWKILFEEQISKKKKALYVGAIVVFMLVALLMGTKKSVLIFIVGLIALCIQKTKNQLKTIRTIVFAAIICALGYIVILKTPILYSSIGYRINDFFNEVINEDTDSIRSTTMRRRFMSEAIDVFKENPIIGIGQDGFRYKNTIYPTYSHCNYTELMANLGVIGLILYYSVYILLFKGARNKADKYSMLMISLLLVMLVTDIGEVSYSTETKYVLFGLLAGLINEDTKEQEIEDGTAEKN